ncbi:conserved hypothetical protein [Mesorhizobium plurifarium]|uniref:General stress protein 17M-like domain-containing protein n=1 Tax=Mesorhizobium plurifarium TaxID=69974 RepID=A0A090G478_MESPL|nr:conserved hypothetical protein [Mesorhizobium plurifarium]
MLRAANRTVQDRKPHMKVVIGLFDTYDDADQAIRELGAAGISPSDISVVAHGANRWYAHHRSQVAEDAVAGACLGGLVGGTAGLLAGLGVIAIPGLGSLAAAGWLAATTAGALTGAAAVGAAGGITSALIGSGLAKEDAGVYAEGIRRGGTLVVARVKDPAIPDAEQILRARSVNLAERRSEYEAAGWTGFDPYAG